MTRDYRRAHYRLRKAKCRAIFYVVDHIYVVYVGKRDEGNRLWELYEDLRDCRVVEEFEIRGDAGDVEFGSFDDPT